MTTKWGAEHFKVGGLNFGGVSDFSLEGAVKLLPARVKSAFYGAIVCNGVIHRGTWNGCAFNAGGFEVKPDVNISSFQMAAEVFNVSQAIVKRFISAWDHYQPNPNTDEQATQDLLGLLEKVGVFTDPDFPQKRIVNDIVYEGTKSDLEIVNEMLTNLSSDFEVLLDQATELLIGAGV